jgi:hypothetical protein
MTGCFKAGAIGAIVLVGMAAAGCKQPAGPAASSTPAAATSMAAPAPANDAAAGGRGKGNPELRQARREVREACSEDLQACKAAGGDVRPMRCLRNKLDQLKPACKQALQTMMAERREGKGGRAAG